MHIAHYCLFYEITIFASTTTEDKFKSITKTCLIVSINIIQIGEVELVVDPSQNKENLESKIESLHELADKMNLNKQLQGKVNHCIKTQNPQGFKILSERQENII